MPGDEPDPSRIVPENLTLFDSTLVDSRGTKLLPCRRPLSMHEAQSLVQVTHKGVPGQVQCCSPPSTGMLIPTCCSSGTACYPSVASGLWLSWPGACLDVDRELPEFTAVARSCRIAAAVAEAAAHVLESPEAQGPQLYPRPCVDLHHVPVPGQHGQLRPGRRAPLRPVPPPGRPTPAVHAEGQVCTRVYMPLFELDQV